MLLKEKNEIIDWLDKHKIKSYTLRADDTDGYVVDVVGSVYLASSIHLALLDLEMPGLVKIPVKFGIVSGSFNCMINRLTSLEGCPDEVGGDFWCSHNQLTSLEGGPQVTGGNFYCYHNQLKSLIGSPRVIRGRYFDCSNNELMSLEGMPETVEGKFLCHGNSGLDQLQKIESFKEIKSYLLSEKLANDLHIKDNNRKVKL